MKITRGKMIGLLIVIMFTIILNLAKDNKGYRRFISEDMKQSTERFNKHFYTMEGKINNILLKKDGEKQVSYNEINKLRTIHITISRELFYLHKKYRKLEKKHHESFEELYDNFTEEKDIITDYYENLNKRLEKEIEEEPGKKKYITLKDDDISQLRSILSFYSNTKKELEKLMR